jgi:hypothetical protein
MIAAFRPFVCLRFVTKLRFVGLSSVSINDSDGEARLDSQQCLQCRTILVDGNCAHCENEGKQEALALVMALVSIAVVLVLYVTIKLV